MSKFQHESGDWVRFRALPNLTEIDFHYGSGRNCETPYWERMRSIGDEALNALKAAQAGGKDWVLFRHGASTSRLGKETARSVVRGVIRSSAATPFVLKSKCIQHETVFVARVRQA